jgi:hypothetical protein
LVPQRLLDDDQSRRAARARFDATDDRRANSAVVQAPHVTSSVPLGQADEQPAGGLRIDDHLAQHRSNIGGKG